MPKLFFVLLLIISASAADVPSPAALAKQSKASYEVVRGAVVSVNSGSGVIISAEGHILTAAHMNKGGKYFKVALLDGRKAFAEPLGTDRTADIALLKITKITDKLNGVDPETITAKPTQPWPFVQLAPAAPAKGAFCFTLGHPAGALTGRPAQLRLGRITHMTKVDGRTETISSDCTIQPGDSGGPLFDLSGKLIGINSTASPFPGCSSFAKIDDFHKFKDRYYNKGEVWGEAFYGDDKKTEGRSITQEVLKKVSEEYKTLIRQNYPPLIRYIDDYSPYEGGHIRPNMSIVLKGLDGITMAVMSGSEYVFGMQDPAIVKQWPLKAGKHIPPLKLVDTDNTQVLMGYGLPVSERHFIAKWEIFRDQKEICIGTKTGGVIKAKFINGSAEWNLALYDMGKDNRLKPVEFTHTEIAAGEALISPDFRAHAVWGISCDVARPIAEARSVGSLRDDSYISKHRSPYPMVTNHNLPLWAKDVGRPIYNDKDEFVGMHIARHCRTFGLIMGSEDIRELYQSWLKTGPTPDMAYPPEPKPKTKKKRKRKKSTTRREDQEPASSL